MKRLRNKPTGVTTPMLAPWDSLIDLQQYQDWLTRTMIWGGVIVGVIFAIATGALGFFQYKISNQIEILRKASDGERGTPINARLRFDAMTTKKDRPGRGEIIGGFPWKDEFGQGRLVIANDTQAEIKDIELLVVTDIPIAAAGQTTAIRNVRTEIKWPILPEAPQGQIRRLATTAGISVRCPALPSESCVEIIMGAIAVPKSKQPDEVGLINSAYADRGFLFLKEADGVKTLWGREDFKAGFQYAIPEIKKVEILGKYRVGDKEQIVSEEVVVGSDLREGTQALLSDQQRAFEKQELAMQKDGPKFEPEGPPSGVPLSGTMAPVAGPESVKFSVKNTGPSRAKVTKAGMQLFALTRGGTSDDSIPPANNEIAVKDQVADVKPGETYNVPLTDFPAGGKIPYQTAAVVRVRIIYRDENEEEFEATFRYDNGNNPREMYAPPESRGWQGGLVRVKWLPR